MTLEEKINRLRAAEKRLRKKILKSSRLADYQEAVRNLIYDTSITAGQRYRDLEEQGRLLVLPCKVGDTVYEILEETVPNHYFYISEWKVQDVSVKAVKYADEWASYDYENLYFTREEAEAALKKRGRRA